MLNSVSRNQLLELKNVIESSYQDGITAITSIDVDDNDSIVGIFEDKVSDNLTKRYIFKITDEKIAYKLIPQGEEKTEFSEDDDFDLQPTLNFGSITDPELLLELRDILETQYQDGITAISEARLNSDDSFSGIFEDKIDSKLTKRFKFAIANIGSDNEISYSLLNALDANSSFTDGEQLEFASKKAKNCTKGVSCGAGCISANKTCRKAADVATKKKVAQVRKKVKSGDDAESPGKKAVPDVTIGKNGAAYYMSDVSALKGGASVKSKEVDRIAKQITESGGKLSTPIIVIRKGTDLEVAKDPGNELLATAARKAKQLDSRKGEMVSTYTVKNQQEADAVLFQRQIASKAESAVPPVGKGEFQFIDVKSVSGGKKSALDAETLEKVSQSQLKVGNALPLIVRRTQGDQFEVVHGDTAIAAGRLAREKDPRRGEMINAFIID